MEGDGAEPTGRTLQVEEISAIDREARVREAEGTRSAGASRQAMPRPRHHDKEIQLLDSVAASWPFFVVQSLFLLLCGYMLRGYTDKRRRRRLQPAGGAAWSDQRGKGARQLGQGRALHKASPEDVL